MQKNQFFIIVGNFMYLVAQWALSVLVVRLSTDFYAAGNFGLALTITNVFYIIACYGMRSFQISDVKKKYSDQTYTLSRIITVAVGALACLVYLIWIDYEKVTFAAIMTYMVYKCFEAASDVLYGIFQNNNRYDLMCLSMSLKGIASVAVFVALLVGTSSLVIALFGMCVVALATFLLEVHWGKIYAQPLVRFDATTRKAVVRLLMESALMVVLLIAQPLLMSIPRLYFEQCYSRELLGIYSSLSAPAMIVTTFVSCAMMPYLPLFGKYYLMGKNANLYRLTFGSLGFTVIFGVIAYVGGGLFGEWGLTLLYGESIAGYTGVFQLIIIVATLSAMTMCLNTLYIAMRKLRLLSVVLMLGCLVAYIITPYFVQNYAMNGVTYALMISQLFQIFVTIALAIYYINRNKAREDSSLTTHSQRKED